MREGKILLVAADWRTRALLLAELEEAGYDVVALPGVRWALVALAGGRLTPALVVLDVTGDAGARSDQVHRLLGLLGDTPVVLLVGAYDARVFAPLRDRVAAWLSRPLRLARVVDTVRHLHKAIPFSKGRVVTNGFHRRDARNAEDRRENR